MPALQQLLREIDPKHPWVQRILEVGTSTSVISSVAYRVLGRAVEARRSVVGPDDGPLLALDLQIHGRDIVLWTMRGGRFESSYPPMAFQPVARSLTPGLPVPRSVGGAHRIEFGSTGGRSADGDVPLFLLSDLEGTQGLWLALGHSARWQGTLTKEPGLPVQRLTLTAPMGSIGPGVALDLPRVVVGTYEGDGWAAIRRFLAEQCPRRIAPPIVYNTWFNLDGEVDEASCLAAIDAAAELGVEYVVVDAAWYGGSGTDFGGPGLGTWTVDIGKFPRGLGPVAAAARAAGLGLGLWFEPERANRESAVVSSFPDAFRPIEGTSVGLVDFGHPGIQEWAVRLLDTAVADLGLAWLKWDFNVHGAGILWGTDAVAELAHTRGVHAVLDRLRALHPNLIIEMCASGGNRIDIEILARSHVTNLSDQAQSPEIVRRHLGNASRWLPAQYRFGGFGPQAVWAKDGSVSPASTGGPYPAAWLLSAAAGTIGIHEPIGRWDHATKASLKEHLDRHKSFRHLLDGTFRMFQDDGAGLLQGWEGWEFSDDPTGAAVLVAFRQHAAAPRHAFVGTRRWDVSIPDRDGVLLTIEGPSER